MSSRNPLTQVDATMAFRRREKPEEKKKQKRHDVATMRYGMGMSTRIA